jgi:hypothetical protein
MIAQLDFTQYIFVDFKLFQEINFTKFIDQGKMLKQATYYICVTTPYKLTGGFAG